MAVAPPALIIGAARTPLPYGLFSTFTWRTTSDRWEAGTEYEAGTCDPADGVGVPDCEPGEDGGTTATGLPKNLASNRADLGTATPFTIYGHHNCSPVGYSEESASQAAISHLMNREEARVEQAFWTGDLGNTPNLTDAETVTAGTATMAGAIGALEAFGAANYGSLGVMHVARDVATVLLTEGVLKVSNGRLATVLGTPVAAGAGYPGTGPDGSAPVAGQGWAYITPALFGYRSEVFGVQPVLDTRQNDYYAVAERNYLLGFDPCGVGAVQIDLTA